MIREIIKDPNILVKSKTFEVRTNNDLVIKMVQDMDDTLEADKDMVFLCSNEVGFEERAIDIKFTDETVIMFNPAFRKRDQMVLVREIDRINGKEYIIPRYNEVEIVYQDCLGSVKCNLVKGPVSTMICQAMDVLNGVTSSDYGMEVVPEFDKASPEQQQEVLEFYMNTLKETFTKLDKELSENEDTKEAWSAAKFLKASAEGEIEFEKPEEMSNREKKRIKEFMKQAKAQANKLRFWKKK